MIILDEKAKKEYLYYCESIKDALHKDNIYNRDMIDRIKELIYSIDVVLTDDEYKKLKNENKTVKVFI